MAMVVEERESGAEIVIEPDAVVNERLERAVHAQAIHIIRGVDGADDPSLVLLMELGECDAVYGFCLDDAEWLVDQIAAAIAAMRR